MKWLLFPPLFMAKNPEESFVDKEKAQPRVLKCYEKIQREARLTRCRW